MSQKITVQVDVQALRRQHATLRDNFCGFTAADASDLCGILGLVGAMLAEADKKERAS